MASSPLVTEHPRKKPVSRMWMPAMLNALGLSLSMLAVAALVRVMDFARSDPSGRNPAPDVSAPPPMYGPLPSFALRDDQDRPLGPQQLHGQLTLVQFASSQDDVCRFESLRLVQERLASREAPVRVVIVMSRASPDAERQALPQGWRRVWDGAGLAAAVRELGQKALPDDAVSRARPWSALVLVDQLGGVRGVYAQVHDEQTAERIVEDAHHLRTCGPLSVLATFLK